MRVNHTWDFAGADGLQAAMRLFSTKVGHIAPFQSYSTELDGQPCAVLRLCENNFRVVLAEQVDFESVIASLNLCVWSKPYLAATLLFPAEEGLATLRKIATTKPVYTLVPFPCDRAVPTRIDGTAILAWHHLWQGKPVLHIHTATKNIEKIRGAFSSFDDVKA